MAFEKEGSIALISFEEFERVIGGLSKEVVESNKESHEHRNLEGQNKYKEIAGKIKFEKLVIIKELGQGQFGMVYLVKDLESKQLFALKTVNKAQVVQQNIEAHLLVRLLSEE